MGFDVAHPTSMKNYLKLCTEFYDIDKPHAPPATLERIERYARAANGPILEPMCGSGRYLLPLLERGFEVDGTDASPHMLAACRARCAARGFSPELYEQALHELAVPKRYELALILDGSFSLLTDADQARASLERLRGTLRPTGKLVIEVERFKEEQASHSWPWGGRWVDRPDGTRLICSWLGHYDAAKRTSYGMGRYELVKDGRLLETELESFDLRYYAADEFGALLRAAGFESVKLVGSDDQGWSAPGDGSLLFEAGARTEVIP